jgi:hypothetical protein
MSMADETDSIASDDVSYPCVARFDEMKAAWCVVMCQQIHGENLNAYSEYEIYHTVRSTTVVGASTMYWRLEYNVRYTTVLEPGIVKNLDGQ